MTKPYLFFITCNFSLIYSFCNKRQAQIQNEGLRKGGLSLKKIFFFFYQLNFIKRGEKKGHRNDGPDPTSGYVFAFR